MKISSDRTRMWRAYKQLPVACETSSPLIEGAKEIRRDEYFGNGKLVRRLYKQQVMVCEPIFFHTSNRPFPSSLVPLFQNESKCETFHLKMSSACSFIFMQIKVNFVRMVSHLDSL